jgi:hypothetical protein
MSTPLWEECAPTSHVPVRPGALLDLLRERLLTE